MKMCSNEGPPVTTSAEGRKRITGSDGLKDTQTYPPLFGHAVAAVCSAHYLDTWRTGAGRRYLANREITFDELFNETDEWDDAALGPVFDLLMAQVANQRDIT